MATNGGEKPRMDETIKMLKLMWKIFYDEFYYFKNQK